MVADTELYDRLGVTPESSDGEIRKAYLKLARRWHPDRNPGDEDAKEKFQALQEAHEILLDQQKRGVYDQFGLEAVRHGGENGGFGGGMGGMGGLFERLFRREGAGASADGPRKGPSARHDLSLPLEDFFNGAEKHLRITRKKRCLSCEATGSRTKTKPELCAACGGTGATVKVERAGNMIRQMQLPCEACHGRGELVPDPGDLCDNCQGDKVVEEKKVLTVNVERGMRDGHTVKFHGEADELPVKDVEPGDVLITLRQREHEVFHRKEANLIMEIRIGLIDALTGFETAFRHLDKEERWVSIRTQPGEVLGNDALRVVPNEGMPIPRSTAERGHLFINFKVDFPEKMDAEEARELKNYLPASTLKAAADIVPKGAALDEGEMVLPTPEHVTWGKERVGDAYASSDEEGDQGGVQCAQQ